LLCKKDNVTYSSNHEDQILDILTGKKDKGFYIDIGANDPNHISNTKKFYQRGWSGINIEPSLECYGNLLKYRPRDINLHTAIGEGEQDYHEPSHSGGHLSSTFSKKVFEELGMATVPHRVKKMKMTPLTEIFESHVRGREVDFMSIDVEGYEDEVLKSNDWTKFKPKVLCIERWGFHVFLKQFGYKFIMYDGSNSYFKLKK